MNATVPPTRLPANLESAVQRVRMAARTAAERTVDSLGLAALSSNNVFQRDALLGAQFELNRKLAIFALTFNETLDHRVAREAGVLNSTTTGGGITNWDALSLVDDHEVEIQVSADRFALEIAHACEWEIRELDAYMGSLLKIGRADHERNPLRAEVVGLAMIRAIESISEMPETRKVLSAEIGRSLANAMRQTYAEIVAEMRHAGVKPVGLSVRSTPNDRSRMATGPGSLHGELNEQAGPAHDISGSGRLSPRFGSSGHSVRGTTPGALGGYGGGGPGHGAGGGGSGGGGSGGGYLRGTPMGRVEAQMMSVIRRLSHGAAAAMDDSGSAEMGYSGYGGGYGNYPLEATNSGSGVLMAPNLIVAHREELRQAATGALDHMVIDVIAGLFDQILSDPKVPPQMARQIGRLQLPVLRAALGDTSFFSSRKHPVRRFINRIASLGSAVDDFDGEEGRALLARVRELVQDVVEGDFDQIETYERKLGELEAFVAEQSRVLMQQAHHGADSVLARKEDELRVQHRFAQQLEGALVPVPVPDFLRDFLGKTWSRVIAGFEFELGREHPQVKRMREVGRELVMSVQPKGAPAMRAAFLRTLPQLMKDLNAGMDRIRLAEEQRRDFFAQLLPAHAESLKAPALSTLEHNLLAKQVDGVLATPVPKPADLPPPGTLPVLQDAISPADFSAADAQAVGLVDETKVNWNGQVAADATAEPEITETDIDIAGLPPPEPVEPMRGKSLADHVQIGFAYQMHLENGWQKVRLAHVSAGRTFFVFTHGAKQRETISMTYRMLSRMCESERLRAYESAYLLERATARARRQLAALKPAGAPHARATN